MGYHGCPVQLLSLSPTFSLAQRAWKIKSSMAGGSFAFQNAFQIADDYLCGT